VKKQLLLRLPIFFISDSHSGDGEKAYHNEDTRASSRMDTKIVCTKCKQSRVHWSHEEVDGHDSTNGSFALASADVGVKNNGGNTVDDHDEAGRDECGKASGDEATDGEGDQSIRKEVGSLSLSPASVVDGVVDEESTNGDLGTDIAELGNETANHVVLLPDASLSDLTALEIVLRLDERVVALGLLSNLGELGKGEQNGDSDTKARDTEVDKLHIGKVVGILAGEEGLGGNEWTDEGSNTVPCLAELQTRRGGSWVTNDDGV
jgi:hypothetical protein